MLSLNDVLFNKEKTVTTKPKSESETQEKIGGLKVHGTIDLSKFETKKGNQKG